MNGTESDFQLKSLAMEKFFSIHHIHKYEAIKVKLWLLNGNEGKWFAKMYEHFHLLHVLILKLFPLSPTENSLDLPYLYYVSELLCTGLTAHLLWMWVCVCLCVCMSDIIPFVFISKMFNCVESEWVWEHDLLKLIRYLMCWIVCFWNVVCTLNLTVAAFSLKF